MFKCSNDHFLLCSMDSLTRNNAWDLTVWWEMSSGYPQLMQISELFRDCIKSKWHWDHARAVSKRHVKVPRISVVKVCINTHVSFDCFRPLKIPPGDTKLALYGLGALRDERLHRTFQQNNVKWYDPVIWHSQQHIWFAFSSAFKFFRGRPSEDAEDWFNIFVIHQNRYQNSIQ
jgi:hypothetical protein